MKNIHLYPLDKNKKIRYFCLRDLWEDFPTKLHGSKTIYLKCHNLNRTQAMPEADWEEILFILFEAEITDEREKSFYVAIETRDSKLFHLRSQHGKTFDSELLGFWWYFLGLS